MSLPSKTNTKNHLQHISTLIKLATDLYIFLYIAFLWSLCFFFVMGSDVVGRGSNWGRENSHFTAIVWFNRNAAHKPFSISATESRHQKNQLSSQRQQQPAISGLQSLCQPNIASQEWNEMERLLQCNEKKLSSRYIHKISKRLHFTYMHFQPNEKSNSQRIATQKKARQNRHVQLKSLGFFVSGASETLLLLLVVAAASCLLFKFCGLKSRLRYLSFKVFYSYDIYISPHML